MATSTLALFGATGGTGRQVLSLALQKGYRVQVLVRSPEKLTVKEHPQLQVVVGDLSNTAAVEETVQGADLVISVAGGPLSGTGDTPPPLGPGLMTEFVQRLWPILQQTKPRAFLYQGGALAPKPTGGDPEFLQEIRKQAVSIAAVVNDNEAAMKFFHEHPLPDTNVIVIRPGSLAEGPAGQHRLMASEHVPESGQVSFADLATFILEDAITDPSLVGKYPFVKIQQ